MRLLILYFFSFLCPTNFMLLFFSQFCCREILGWKQSKTKNKGIFLDVQMRKHFNNYDCYCCLLVFIYSQKKMFKIISLNRPLAFFQQRFLLSHNNKCIIHFIFLLFVIENVYFISFAIFGVMFMLLFNVILLCLISHFWAK